MTTVLILCAPLIALQTPAAEASGGTERPLLAQARALHDQFEYEKMLEVLDRLLEDPTLSTEERTTALLLKGRGQVASDCSGEALSTYHQLLELNPAYAMPQAESPKVRECFALAQKTRPVAGARERSIETRAPTAPPETTNPSTEPPEATTPMTAVQEERLSSPAPRESSWLDSWWIWALGGGAVAAAAGISGITLFAISQSAPLTDGTLGERVTLNPMP